MTVLPISTLRNKQIAITVQSNAVWTLKTRFECRPAIAAGIPFTAPRDCRNIPRLCVYAPDPIVSHVDEVDVVRRVCNNKVWTT